MIFKMKYIVAIILLSFSCNSVEEYSSTEYNWSDKDAKRKPQKEVCDSLSQLTELPVFNVPAEYSYAIWTYPYIRFVRRDEMYLPIFCNSHMRRFESAVSDMMEDDRLTKLRAELDVILKEGSFCNGSGFDSMMLESDKIFCLMSIQTGSEEERQYLEECKESLPKDKFQIVILNSFKYAESKISSHEVSLRSADYNLLQDMDLPKQYLTDIQYYQWRDTSDFHPLGY